MASAFTWANYQALFEDTRMIEIVLQTLLIAIYHLYVRRLWGRLVLGFIQRSNGVWQYDFIVEQYFNGFT